MICRHVDQCLLIVASLREAERRLERRAVVDREDEDTVPRYVGRNHISTASVVLAASPVVGAAGVEDETRSAETARLDLDPDDAPVGSQRKQVEW